MSSDCSASPILGTSPCDASTSCVEKISRWLDNLGISCDHDSLPCNTRIPPCYPDGSDEVNRILHLVESASRQRSSPLLSPSPKSLTPSMASTAVSIDVETIYQTLADFAAIQILRACYTLPPSYFIARSGPRPQMISSLVMHCHHCCIPAPGETSDIHISKNPLASQLHEDPTLPVGFDGPRSSIGNAGQLEASASGTPIPPSDSISRSRPGSPASLRRRIGKHHWFRHVRKHRTPRLLHVTETSDSHGSQEDDKESQDQAAEGRGEGYVPDMDLGDKSREDLQDATVSPYHDSYMCYHTNCCYEPPGRYRRGP